MTVLTDLNAIALTSSARSAVSAKGADVGNLVANAKTHVLELQFVLKQIVQHHPSTGPDAANYAALQTIIAELA